LGDWVIALALLNQNQIIMKENFYRWVPPEEQKENQDEKQICSKCGNDSFRVYIRIIIDDARLYCSKCGEYHP
jgi:ribosomal protein S27AE